MKLLTYNKIVFFWLSVCLPLLSYYVFKKSFNLALYGDDWLQLYNLWRSFDVWKTLSYYSITSYLNPYWPQYLFLAILRHFWGYEPSAYFYASYILRVFANISIYFLAYGLTKNRLAAFLSTLIFLFSAAGLQTTDWVFNMNTYAGLGLLCFAFTVYLKIRNLDTFFSWHYPSFILLFALALGVVPTRMHGAIPSLILTDLFLTYVIEKQRLKFNKYVIIRVLVPILIFLTLSHFKSFGDSSYTQGRLNESFRIMSQLTAAGRNDFWLYFLAIIGNLIIPDNYNLNGVSTFLDKSISAIGNRTSTILSSSIIFSLVSLAISITLQGTKIKKHLSVLILNPVWLFIVAWITLINPETPKSILFSIFTGGLYIVWTIWLYLVARKSEPLLAGGFIISLIWVFAFTAIYWFFTPYYVIETTGRYMTMGTAGFAIFFACLLSLLFKYSWNLKVKPYLFKSFLITLPLLLLIIWLTLHIQAGQKYFRILEATRNQLLSQNTWDALVKYVPALDTIDGPSVFYFTTDNPLSLEGVLIFGFFPRAGLLYNIENQDLTPLPVKDYGELLAYVKDGSPLKIVHGRKQLPVPLSRVFAFDFRNGELINMTDQIRKKIAADLNLE